MISMPSQGRPMMSTRVADDNSPSYLIRRRDERGRIARGPVTGYPGPRDRGGWHAKAPRGHIRGEVAIGSTASSAHRPGGGGGGGDDDRLAPASKARSICRGNRDVGRRDRGGPPERASPSRAARGPVPR